MPFPRPLSSECSKNINIIKWLEYLPLGVTYHQVIESHIVDLVAQFSLNNLRCWKSSFNECWQHRQYQSQLNEFVNQWKYQTFLSLNHLHSQTLNIFTRRKGSMYRHVEKNRIMLAFKFNASYYKFLIKLSPKSESIDTYKKIE